MALFVNSIVFYDNMAMLSLYLKKGGFSDIKNEV